MASNYLEQLISEWYEYQGYFIRRNVLVGKRPKGGYECELDIVGFHPHKQHLIHIEPSMDADGWQERERRFRKKFEAGKKFIPALFTGFDIPETIDQQAVLVAASKMNHQMLGGGKVVLAKEFIEAILTEMRTKPLLSSAIPEHMHILRSFQFVTHYRQVALTVLGSN